MQTLSIQSERSRLIAERVVASLQREREAAEKALSKLEAAETPGDSETLLIYTDILWERYNKAEKFSAAKKNFRSEYNRMANAYNVLRGSKVLIIIL